MDSLKQQIDLQRLPAHIAIIMDGNGRWAKERGEDRLYGHYQGVESVRDIVEGCSELGVQFLTLYAFSTENWERPVDEVTGLMELLLQTIKKETETLHKNNIRLHVIGELTKLPDAAKKELEESIKLTENNTGLNLVMALSYSGRWELTHAVKKIAAEVKAGNLDPDEISQEKLAGYLETASFPDPELMIRTSGEFRISNFLLFQLAYAELYFTPQRWPDFRKKNLYEAIIEFQHRERRFGKTTDQITPGNSVSAS